MNDTIMAIAANISSLSCAECDPFYSGRKCQDRGEQCRVHFRTMAAHVYTTHVKPLEDELAKSKDWMMIAAKAEADKSVLIKSLKDANNALMRCELTFSFIYHRGNSSVAESGLKAAVNAQITIDTALANIEE